MDNAVALRGSTYASIPSEHEMMVFHTMAEQAVKSKMYRGVGESSSVMMIMLAARELGIAPMQALNGGLHIIEGKVEISARLMHAMIRRAGHRVRVIQSTDDICILEGTRGDTGETLEVSYSIKDAEKAGLVKDRGGWKKCPKDMCFARGISRLSRQHFPDVIGIGYVEGEIVPTTGYEVKDITQQVDDGKVQFEVLSEYSLVFPNEDMILAMEFLEVVKKHFGWDTVYAVKELLKDKPKLVDKFGVWKAKQGAAVPAVSPVQEPAELLSVAKVD
jgi:hypothetical protein